MKKLVFTALLSVTALAAGGKSPRGGREALKDISINPVSREMGAAFDSAEGAVQVTADGKLLPRFELGQTYECEIFPVLKDNNQSHNTAFEAAFNFRAYGNNLFENTAGWSAFSKTRFFGNDPLNAGDLIGRPEDRSLFEAVRMDGKDALITEIQVKEYHYVNFALSLINRQELVSKTTYKDLAKAGLTMPPMLAQQGHVVLAYSYCTKNQE